MDPNEYDDDWSDMNIDWSQFEEPEDEEVVDGLYTEEVAQKVAAENSFKPDPRISYTPLLWEEFSQCPYDPSHLVNQEKLQAHLNKCRNQYELRCKSDNGPRKIQTCKYNSTHCYPASEMQMHEELYPNQGHTFDYKTNAPHKMFANTGIESQAAGPASTATSAQDSSAHGPVRDTLEPAAYIPNPAPISRHAAAAAFFQRTASMPGVASFNDPKFPTPGHVHGTAGQTSSEAPHLSVPSTSADNVVEEDWELEAAMQPPLPNWDYNPVRTMLDNPHLLIPMPAGVPRSVRRAIRIARAEAQRASSADRDVHQPGQFEVDPAHDSDPDAPKAPDVRD